MRDRLIELINEAEYESLKYEMANKIYPFDDYKSRSEFVADHLLANGVIVPPCKVGDSCYPLWHFGNKPIVERKISRITYSARNIIIGYYENDGQYRPPLRTRVLGEDIFLTREEAEKALKERSDTE